MKAQRLVLLLGALIMGCQNYRNGQAVQNPTVVVELNPGVQPAVVEIRGSDHDDRFTCGASITCNAELSTAPWSIHVDYGRGYHPRVPFCQGTRATHLKSVTFAGTEVSATTSNCIAGEHSFDVFFHTS